MHTTTHNMPKRKSCKFVLTICTQLLTICTQLLTICQKEKVASSYSQVQHNYSQYAHNYSQYAKKKKLQVRTHKCSTTGCTEYMKFVEEVVAKRMKSKRFIGRPALPVTPCTSAFASPSLTLCWSVLSMVDLMSRQVI